jgi:hypothetical protein
VRSIVVLLLLASAAVARAERPSLLPERLSAAPCLPAVSNGADFGCVLDGSGRPRLEPSALWPAPETYFAHHSARVEHDLMIFTGGYTLEHMRARDTLLLYGGPAGGARASLLGFGLFSAAIVASAHVPNPVRLLFDGDLHFGPAVFDGGVGAGFGGKL